jgi:hypothetical protein
VNVSGESAKNKEAASRVAVSAAVNQADAKTRSLERKKR